MTTEKNFKGKMILNWKNGQIKILKKKKYSPKPGEIVVNFDLTVKIPEQPEHNVKGTIETNSEEVKAMVIDRLTNSQN